MKLMTMFELASKPETELRVLFRVVSTALNATSSNQPERKIALASLENISRALRTKTPAP